MPRVSPARGERRRELLAVLGILAAVIGAVVVHRLVRSVSPRATSEQCAAMLDRYVEQLAHASDPSPASSTVALARSEARVLAAANPSFMRCSKEVSQDQASCALGANNADELERCLQ